MGERENKDVVEEKEKNYYSDERIQITDKKIIIKSKYIDDKISYIIPHITSVRITKKPPDRTLGVLFAVMGLTLLIGAGFLMDTPGELARYFSTLLFMFGLISLVLGVILALIAKGEYTLKINSSSGESNILGSDDKAYIENIANVINEAITDIWWRLEG